MKSKKQMAVIVAAILIVSAILPNAYLLAEQRSNESTSIALSEPGVQNQQSEILTTKEGKQDLNILYDENELSSTTGNIENLFKQGFTIPEILGGPVDSQSGTNILQPRSLLASEGTDNLEQELIKMEIKYPNETKLLENEKFTDAQKLSLLYLIDNYPKENFSALIDSYKLNGEVWLSNFINEKAIIGENVKPDTSLNLLESLILKYPNEYKQLQNESFTENQQTTLLALFDQHPDYKPFTDMIKEYKQEGESWPGKFLAQQPTLQETDDAEFEDLLLNLKEKYPSIYSAINSGSFTVKQKVTLLTLHASYPEEPIEAMMSEYKKNGENWVGQFLANKQNASNVPVGGSPAE
ncbi:hypothetical protein [Paenibacillus chitinolyticus]|uniref:hypothetical protein n=1 Tax=Paenibacillus chitinolyticus TaxID=79263 RepID=UPI00363CEFB8